VVAYEAQVSDITWTTVKRRLGDLIEWDKNPRRLSKHDGEHIKRSMDKFGLADPLVINLDNHLIGGHQRKHLLADPNLVVDVRVPSRQLTEAEAEELAIRLNKAQGQWDFDLLANNWQPPELIEWGSAGLILMAMRPKTLARKSTAPRSCASSGALSPGNCGSWANIG
jgi:hypothetical protein